MQSRSGSSGLYGDHSDFGHDGYNSDRLTRGGGGGNFRGDRPGYGRDYERSGYQVDSRGGRDGGRFDNGWSGNRRMEGRSRHDSDNRSQNGANLPRELSPS